MRRLTVLTMSLALIVFSGCKQTADDRYQRYLEEVNDTSRMEFITPEEDKVPLPDDNDIEPFSKDDGIYTIPAIPQERSVNMGVDAYEVERVMMGKE